MKGAIDLPERTRTAIVLVGGLLILEFAGAFSDFGRLLLATLGATAAVLAAWELCSFSKQPWRTLWPMVVPALLPIAWAGSLYLSSGAVSVSYGCWAFSVALGGFFLGLLICASGRAGLATVERTAGTIGIGFVLVGIGGGSLVTLALCPNAVSLTLWLIAVVCCNDIAAYFGGKQFAGPKIAPNLSPNKTISGSLCGFAGGVLVSLAISSNGLMVDPFYPMRTSEAAALALIVVAGAQVGDLLKSFLKRLYGVKDSGTILPGHGGVLDRVDGLLGGAPLLLGWVMWRSL